MEMYNAIETKGEGALRGKSSTYTASPAYVSLPVYKETIKPLIEQFLKENKEFLKSIGFDLFK